MCVEVGRYLGDASTIPTKLEQFGVRQRGVAKYFERIRLRGKPRESRNLSKYMGV